MTFEPSVISMKRRLIVTTIHESGRAAWARRWLLFSVAALMSLAGANAVFAQSVSSGTIEGTVKDESNAVLPGVTVTVTSPQLQVGLLVQVSDTAGSYKFVDLPAGVYRLKAELTGFSTSVREDLRLTVGFNARVDLTLKLGAMEESVTVSGLTPVVDVTSTSASVAFTKDVLDSIPRGRDFRTCWPWRLASRRRSPMWAAARWRSARTCRATVSRPSRSSWLKA